MGIEERRQEREIDGIKYFAQPIPAGIGLKLLEKLTRSWASLVAKAMREDAQEAAKGVKPGKEGEAMVDVKKLLTALPEVITGADLEVFAEAFGKSSWVQNVIVGDDGVETEQLLPLVSATREYHFAGEYWRFMRWIVFCLDVNYRSFFTGMMQGTTVGQELLGLMTKPSK